MAKRRGLSKEALKFFQDEGRKGGKIGGKARADSLTKSERSAIAKKAAAARWKKKEDKQE
jgi:hypothetical protein